MKKWLPTLIAGIVCATSAILYGILGTGRGDSETDAVNPGRIGAAVFKDFPADTISRIDIAIAPPAPAGSNDASKESPPPEKYVLKKQPDGSWRATSHRNRPVQDDFVRNILNALADGEIFEIRPVDNESLTAFFLAAHVTATDSNGHVAADIVIGSSVPERAGIFCQLPRHDSIYVVSGDDFNFHNFGLNYIRHTRRDLLRTYTKALVGWQSQIREFLKDDPKRPIPPEILANQPTPGVMEAMTFNSRDMYDRTVLKVLRRNINRIYVDMPAAGEFIDLRRIKTNDMNGVDEWEVRNASGFKHADSITVKTDLVNNMLKRFEDGKGLQADNYAPLSLIGDPAESGLATPYWRLTLFGKNGEKWQLAIGQETDALTGDTRAVSSSSVPGDLFIMGPVIYKSFAFKPEELLAAE